jgi:hypothetical protein
LHFSLSAVVYSLIKLSVFIVNFLKYASLNMCFFSGACLILSPILRLRWSKPNIILYTSSYNWLHFINWQTVGKQYVSSVGANTRFALMQNVGTHVWRIWNLPLKDSSTFMPVKTTILLRIFLPCIIIYAPESLGWKGSKGGGRTVCSYNFYIFLFPKREIVL